MFPSKERSPLTWRSNQLPALLQAVCSPISLALFQSTADDDGGDGLSRPKQSTESSSLDDSMSRGPHEYLEACLHVLQHIHEDTLSSIQGFTQAQKLHTEALRSSGGASGDPPAQAAQHSRELTHAGVPDLASMTDGLQRAAQHIGESLHAAADAHFNGMRAGLAAVEGLFSLLCSAPLQWLDRHDTETWRLLIIALTVQSFLLKASAVFGGESRQSGASPYFHFFVLAKDNV